MGWLCTGFLVGFIMNNVFVHELARLDSPVSMGQNVKIWANVHIRERVTIGDNTIVGEGAYIGPDVEIGRNCKIQNSAQIHGPAKIHDGVFIGPGVIFTNDRFPRAVGESGELLTADDWNPVGSEVLFGASIGAGAIVVSPVSIGKFAMVAAGSVVTRSVPGGLLVAGVPAKRVSK